MQFLDRYVRRAACPRRFHTAAPLYVVALLLALSVVFADTVAAVSEGHSVRPLHGPGYEHLDCSACLGVSRTLYERLNKTLNENPSTYLASHRLDRTNKLRRMPYRNSELLATEVMDNLCTSYQNDERMLRIHPKSKVRLYHQQVWKDTNLGVRESLREEEIYPPGTTEPWWEDAVELRRYQTATVYSPKDQEALHGMEGLFATPTMCATLVESFEEEMDDLVKMAHTIADFEYGLCGLPLPAAAADAEEVKATIQPITNICARTELLRAAARQDQLRWSQYMRREERRKAKIAEKLEASQPEAAAEAAESTTAVEGAAPLDAATSAAAAAAEREENAPALVREVFPAVEEEESAQPFDSDAGDL